MGRIKEVSFKANVETRRFGHVHIEAKADVDRNEDPGDVLENVKSFVAQELKVARDGVGPNKDGRFEDMIKGEPEVMEEDLAHSGENPLNPGRITSSHVGSGTLKLGTGKLKELLNSERVAKALRDSMDKQMIVGIAGKDLKAGDMVTVDEHGRLIEIRNDWVNGEKIVKRETQDGRITVQKISMKDPGGRRPEDFFITIDEALEEKLKMGAFTQDQLRDLFKKEVTAEHRRRDKEDKLR